MECHLLTPVPPAGTPPPSPQMSHPPSTTALPPAKIPLLQTCTAGRSCWVLPGPTPASPRCSSRRLQGAGMQNPPPPPQPCQRLRPLARRLSEALPAVQLTVPGSCTCWSRLSLRCPILAELGHSPSRSPSRIHSANTCQHVPGWPTSSTRRLHVIGLKSVMELSGIFGSKSTAASRAQPCSTARGSARRCSHTAPRGSPRAPLGPNSRSGRPRPAPAPRAFDSARDGPCGDLESRLAFTTRTAREFAPSGPARARAVAGPCPGPTGPTRTTTQGRSRRMPSAGPTLIPREGAAAQRRRAGTVDCPRG